MQHIAFTFDSSLASNDHQVRILIDGQDLISQFDDDMLGIDPPEFFAAQALSQPGELIFARCGCGSVGCGDGTAQTTRDGDTVTWASLCPEIPSITSLTFWRKQFDAAVATAANNHDWETTERTAERLIAELDFSTLHDQGLAFCWASGRLKDKKISVCYVLQSQYQVIAHSAWDHKNPETAVSAIRNELLRPPHEWSDVRYYSQSSDLFRPPLCGPGWQRG